MGRVKLSPQKKKVQQNIRMRQWVIDALKEKGVQIGPESEAFFIRKYKLKEPKCTNTTSA